jgi:integrase/recombinase XerD
VRTRGGAERAPKVRALARGPLAFEAHMSAFLAQLEAHHYSAALRYTTRRILPRLFSHLREKGVRDVRAVGEGEIISFARALAKTKTKRGKPPALQSQNSYRAVVRRFFSYLEKNGAIFRDPARELPYHRLDVLPRQVMSEKDAEALMEAPSRTRLVALRDRAILETLYGTGVRLSECGRLDLEDLDLAGESLLVRNGKGGKDRVVPVPARAAAALDVYLKDVRPFFVRDPKEEALFLQRYGGRLSTVMIGLLVGAYGRSLGIKIAPHGLRHACATHLLRHGADIRHVQQLLGHRDIQTTALYTGVTLDDLRKVLARAHPRERAKRSWRREGGR